MSDLVKQIKNIESLYDQQVKLYDQQINRRNERIKALEKVNQQLLSIITEWFDLKKVSPIPRRSYLIASKTVGTVMDVAFFEGPKPSGGLWWILGDIELSSSSITHFAALNEPNDE